MVEILISYSGTVNIKLIWKFVTVQAFASQFVYCRNKLELDPEKINVNGGALALGHPLGATGIY